MNFLLLKHILSNYLKLYEKQLHQFIPIEHHIYIIFNHHMIFNCSLTLHITLYLPSPIKMCDTKSQKPKTVSSVGLTISDVSRLLLSLSITVSLHYSYRYIGIRGESELLNCTTFKHVFPKAFKQKMISKDFWFVSS